MEKIEKKDTFSNPLPKYETHQEDIYELQSYDDDQRRQIHSAYDGRYVSAYPGIDRFGQFIQCLYDWIVWIGAHPAYKCRDDHDPDIDADDGVHYVDEGIDKG